MNFSLLLSLTVLASILYMQRLPGLIQMYVCVYACMYVISCKKVEERTPFNKCLFSIKFKPGGDIISGQEPNMAGCTLKLWTKHLFFQASQLSGILNV